MKYKIFAIIGVLMLIGSILGVSIAKAANPVSQPITITVEDVTLCVSITPVNWDGNFGSVVKGFASESHQINVVNCSNVAVTLTITGVGIGTPGGLYETWLQGSTDNTSWGYVSTGWQMQLAKDQAIALYFRVDVPASATAATYAGNINFNVSQ